MAPVVWKNGWPEFDLGGDEVKYSYPINAKIDKKREAFNGNYHFKDEFDQASLNVRYQFLRTVRNEWYSLKNNPGSLSLQLQSETVSGRGNPSFISFHQPHLKGYAATSLSFTPAAENEKAGILLFQNEKVHYYLCKSIKEGKEVVELYKADSLVKSVPLNIQAGKEIHFKIEAKTDQYAFYYATQKDKWNVLLDNADAKYLSTKSAGGFVGCVYAMYATSNGKPSANQAHYDWFEIKNNDDMYK